MAIEFYDSLNIDSSDDSYFLGDVGIGTTSPEGNLEISDSTQATGATLSITNAHNGSWVTGDKIGSIDFRIDDPSATEFVRAKIHAEGKTNGTFPSNSQLVFSTTNGNTLSEKMRIDSTGNVGIGTAIPGELLEINAPLTPKMRFRRAASYYWDIGHTSSDFQFESQTGGVIMHLEYDGNVGIGTTDPGYKLDVNGSLHSSNITLADGIYHEGDTNTYINFLSDTIQMSTGGSVRTYINSSGNVGIGTTSPTEKLEVVGNVILDASNARLKIKGGITGTNSGIDWTFSSNSTQYAKIELDYDDRATTGLLIDSGYPLTLDYSSSRFAVQYNGVEQMRVNTSGNVGIGTTSPGEKLEVDGNVKADSFVKDGGTSTQYLMADGSVSTSSGGSSPWTTDTNGITYTAGNVGIGTASQAGLDLAVSGAARFNSSVRVDGNTQMDGDLTVFGSTSLSGDLAMNGQDIGTEGGDILDNNDSAGAIGSFLMSKGAGDGVRWIPVSAASFDAVTSVTTGEPSGSDSVINVVSLTQAEYDAGTPVATTLYIIT